VAKSKIQNIYVDREEYPILEAIRACQKYPAGWTEKRHVNVGGISYTMTARRQKNRLISINLTEDQLLLPGILTGPGAQEKVKGDDAKDKQTTGLAE
jgi:hypothetical protein